MNIYLLKKYRKLAQEEYKLKEIIYEYPRCRYRWMHDEKELLPKYQILEHGSVKYFENLQKFIVYTLNSYPCCSCLFSLYRVYPLQHFVLAWQYLLFTYSF